MLECVSHLFTTMAINTLLTAILLLQFLVEPTAWAAGGGAGCKLTPASQSDAQNLGDLSSDPFEIRLKNGMSFQLSNGNPDGSGPLDNLTAEEATAFFSRRKDFLGFVAKFLAFPRVLGSMSLVKNKVMGCFGAENTSTLNEYIRFQTGEGMLPPSQITQMGYNTIANVLLIIDTQLWHDAEIFVKAKNKTTSLILGIAGGAAIVNYGAYRFYGLQVDLGYDFETKSSYMQTHWMKQTLKDAKFVIEGVMSIGLIRQYSMTRADRSEDSTLLNIPLGLVYRYNDKTLGAGLLTGLQFSEAAGWGLLAMGHYKSGAILFGIGRVLNTVYYYRTVTTQTKLGPEVQLTPLKARFKKLFNWISACKNILKQQPLTEKDYFH